MSTMTVTLPSGAQIKGVPIDATDDMIRDQAIKNGWATNEDFQPRGAQTTQTAQAPSAPVQESEQDAPWYSKAGTFLKENMEIPVGLGGALAGTAAGIPGGPVGMIAGGIIGGALGSGGGSLLSDELKGEDLNYAEAVKEAGLSVGIDLATLGLGKIAKPGYFAMRSAMGFPAKETAEDLLRLASEGAKVGSQESLMATQRLLQEGGATLTPFQTNRASGAQIFAQRLGEVGLFSSGIMEENAALVNKVANDSLQEIISRAATRDTIDPSTLGQDLFEVISLGKQANSIIYEEGLTEISSRIAAVPVQTSIINATVKRFIKENKREFGSVLDPATLSLVRGIEKTLKKNPAMKAGSLLDYEKKIMQQINKFGDMNSGVYNTTADMELGKFSSLLRDSVQNTLKTVDSEAADSYASLKKAYAANREGMLPELNASFVRKAGKDDFDALGKLVMGVGSNSKIAEMLKSIDVAYKTMAEAGVKAPLKTAADAKQAIKQGFLQKTFPSLGEEFDISKYKGLADQLNNPETATRFRIILGDDYGRVKQITNLMKEASEKPTSNIGQLVLRSKEYAAVGGLGAAAFGGATAGLGAGLLTGGAVLVTPVMLAKMSTNPKTVNALLTLQKRKFATPEALSVAATNLVADFMRELPEEEQAEIRNSVR